jgi:uncharacterized protein YraI
MRPARTIGGMSLLLAICSLAQADPPVPKEAVIAVPEVDVRSGPSPKYYATSKLHQGDRVKIVEEKEGGWLAIQPPAGSFSWINTRYIDHDGQAPTARVLGEGGVPVRVGSALTNQEPDVSWVKLPRGEQVVLLSSQKAVNGEGIWLPIQPPPKEVRFIPADAIKATPPVQSTSSAPANADPLFTQAEQAQKAGNNAEALRLYQQLADQTKDNDLRVLCYNRIHFLQEGNRNYSTVSPCPPGCTPTPYAYGQTPNPGYPYGSPAGQPLQYTYFRQGQAPPVGQPPAATPTIATVWSEPGWLRRSAFQIDGKATYVLESSAGQPRLYVTAQPGVNLEPYVNRTVNLYGPKMYRGEVRTNYMIVSQVAPVP